MIQKFRAWSPKFEKMYGVTLIDFINGDVGLKDKNGGVAMSNLDSLSIMQSTGLFDKNGMEIFEGDLIQWFYGESEILEQKGVVDVVWKNGAFRPFDEADGTLYDLLEMCKHDWYEVVGNIHNNPELLGR